MVERQHRYSEMATGLRFQNEQGLPLRPDQQLGLVIREQVAAVDQFSP
jgi:hypothetical protein